MQYLIKDKVASNLMIYDTILEKHTYWAYHNEVFKLPFEKELILSKFTKLFNSNGTGINRYNKDISIIMQSVDGVHWDHFNQEVVWEF